MRNFTQACQSDCQSCNPLCTQCSKVLFLVQTTETQRFSSKKNRRNQWRYLDQVILFKNRSDVKLNYLSNAGFSICVKTQMRQIYEVRPSISPRKQNITEIFLLSKISVLPHTIVKQICFLNGNVLFLSLYPRTERIMQCGAVRNFTFLFGPLNF